MSKFQHFDLKIIKPDFGSKLTSSIIALDYLRRNRLGGSTHPVVFFQLKNLFHTLESIESARIEGNRTTIVEYIETTLDAKPPPGEEIKEINNIEDCLKFIDQHIENTPVSRAFVSELHKRVVNGLSAEGSRSPGVYRKKNLTITGSNHKPPEATQVDGYMQELFKFFNTDMEPKYDLLKTALAHHRFVWIHPFDNGNGRTVRLLTYAMLIKQGFNIHVGRIVNPTAIFCNDRNAYYQALAKADSGTKQGLIHWCQYMLTGLKHEIEKIDSLLNHEYLLNEILMPTIDISLERKIITEQEEKILKLAAKKKVIQAKDIRTIMPKLLPEAISRLLRKLKEKKMLIPEKENTRKYVLGFQNNYLLRGIIGALQENGFLPLKE